MSSFLSSFGIELLLSLCDILSKKRPIQECFQWYIFCTDTVKITENINVNEKGTYEIKYSVTDENIETTKTVKVNVVSDYDYLSDYTWVSTETDYGTPRKNSNIKGRVNGDIKTFKKGFGIHANGKIVYDLSDKDYDTFEALLGVDMGIESQNNSIIKFKIV